MEEFGRRVSPRLVPEEEGHFTEYHRYLLQRLLSHAGYLERQVEDFDRHIAPRVDEILSLDDWQRLDRIPGVNGRMIENVIAEIGADMNVFPDEHHLSSWSGFCPGNEESAGRRLHSRTRKANPWLRRALVEAAWAASQQKDSYLSAQYRRLVARRGKKRALVAVAHSILVVINHILKNTVEYQDLGPDYFDRLEPEHLQRYLVNRLPKMGYDVALTSRKPDDRAA